MAVRENTLLRKIYSNMHTLCCSIFSLSAPFSHCLAARFSHSLLYSQILLLPHLITQSPWTLFACYFVRIFPVHLLLETHCNSSICTVLNINARLKSAERPTAPATSPTSPEDHLVLADSKHSYMTFIDNCSGSSFVCNLIYKGLLLFWEFHPYMHLKTKITLVPSMYF